MSGPSKKHEGKVLFITNPEPSESNVFLATMHAVLDLKPWADIHCASLGALRPNVEYVVEHLRRTKPETNPITFHELRGIPMKQAMNLAFSRPGAPPRIPNYLPVSALKSPSLFNTMQSVRDIIPLFVPYDGPQLVEIYSSIVETIQEVQADLIVVDTLMTAALTACHHLNLKGRYICLSPNTLKEFTLVEQPYGKAFWKFPAVPSGLDYPVPWHLIPMNIFFMFFTFYTFLTDERRSGIAEYLKSKTGATLRTPIDLMRNREPGTRILVASQQEVDFPLKAPDWDQIIPCGPIYLETSPVATADPGLDAWLKRGPTIFVNMGSLVRVSEERAVELATGLAIVLETLGNKPGLPQYQVVWKIMKLNDYSLSGAESKIEAVLSKWIEADIARVVEWFPADPSTILKTGHVVCSVHHGGANSYHEAVSAGVPQVILPQWADTFDFANRIEYLGIGRMGSREAKPLWTASEFSAAVLEVVIGDRAQEIKNNAVEVAGKVRHGGAKNAANWIWKTWHDRPWQKYT